MAYRKQAVRLLTISASSVNGEPQEALRKRGHKKREIEIVSEVMEGKSNSEIAETLYIEESTVKIHLKHIFKKLNVKRKTELMRTFKSPTLSFHGNCRFRS